MIGDQSPFSVIARAQVVFWDFDGVIKDSVSVKTAAYKELFRAYGDKVALNVSRHHEANGGVSRFDKMPLYLSWAGEKVTDELIEKFCKAFSKAVIRSVVDSPWVPGVREFLLDKYQDLFFVLVTATPQQEIEEILLTLNIKQCFREVYGAPLKKEDVIRYTLDKQKIMPNEALMIGDSETDLLAAKSNSIPFLLRCTDSNHKVQENHAGNCFSTLIKK